MCIIQELIKNDSDEKLRDYQKQNKKEVYRRWLTENSVMLQMPTGTGKTFLFSSIVKDIHNVGVQLQKAIKVLILVHRQELVDQISYNIGVNYNIAHGIIMSRYWEQVFLPTQIASVQTLNNRLSNWIDKKFDFIIIDEAHHSTAVSYRNICSSFPDAKILGVTATPYRLNGESFKDIFDSLVTSPDIDYFIQNNFLSPYKYYSVESTSTIFQNITSIRDFDAFGDYAINALASIVDTGRVRANILNAYLDHANGLKGIVYTINQQHNLHVCNVYNEAGIEARAIDSKTPKEYRRELINQFKKGDFKVLCNVDIFSEGFDCPDIEFIQIARPTKSLSKYLQQVGRGLRVHPNINETIFLDNVGSYNYFGLPSAPRNWSEFFDGKHTLVSEGDGSFTNSSGNNHRVFFIKEGKENTNLIESVELYSDEQNKFEKDPYPVYVFKDHYKSFFEFYLYGFESKDIITSYEEDEEIDNEEIGSYLSTFFNVYENYYVICDSGYYGISNNDEVIFNAKFDNINLPNGLGLAKVEVKGLYGLIDILNGETIIDCIYDQIDFIEKTLPEYFFLVEKDSKFGIFDCKGNVILNVEYQDLSFEGEFWNLNKNDNWIIVDLKFKEIENFYFVKEYEGFGLIKYKKKYGFWDNTLKKIIIPPIYDKVEYKNNNFITVSNKFLGSNYVGLIDKSMSTILPDMFDKVSFLSSELLAVKGSCEFRGQQFYGYGILNTNGEILITPKYKSIELFGDDYIIARFDNMWIIMDWSENILFSNYRKAEVKEEFENSKRHK